MDDMTENMQLVTKNRKKTKTKGCKVPPMSEERINDLNDLMITYNPHKNRRDCRLNGQCYPPWAYPAESIDDKTSVEFMFHPDVFKTNTCFRGENCTMRACAFLHPGEYYVPRWRACGAIFDGVFYPPLPITYEWFKFIMLEYKTSGPCSATYTHDHGRCHYYHRDANDPDYFYDLRPPLEYNFEGDNWMVLPKGATLTARQYHPSTYKIEECRRIGNNQKCSKGRYCSFGHLNNEFQRIEEHFRRLAAEFISQREEMEGSQQSSAMTSFNQSPEERQNDGGNSRFLINSAAMNNASSVPQPTNSGNAWTDSSSTGATIASSTHHPSLSNGVESGTSAAQKTAATVAGVSNTSGRTGENNPDTPSTTQSVQQHKSSGPSIPGSMEGNAVGVRSSSPTAQSIPVATNSATHQQKSQQQQQQQQRPGVAQQSQNQQASNVRQQQPQQQTSRQQQQQPQQVRQMNDDYDSFDYSSYLNGRRGNSRGPMQQQHQPGGVGSGVAMMTQQGQHQQQHQMMSHHQGAMGSHPIEGGQRGPFGSFISPSSHQNVPSSNTRNDMEALWHNPVFDHKPSDALGSEPLARSTFHGFDGHPPQQHTTQQQQQLLQQQHQHIQQQHQLNQHQHPHLLNQHPNIRRPQSENHTFLSDSASMLAQSFDSMNLNSTNNVAGVGMNGQGPVPSFALQQRMNGPSGYVNYGGGGVNGSAYNQGGPASTMVHNDVSGMRTPSGENHDSLNTRNAFEDYYQPPPLQQQQQLSSSVSGSQGNPKSDGWSRPPSSSPSSRFDATPGALHNNNNSSSYSTVLADLTGPNSGSIAQLLMSDENVNGVGAGAGTGTVGTEPFYFGAPQSSVSPSSPIGHGGDSPPSSLSASVDVHNSNINKNITNNNMSSSSSSRDGGVQSPILNTSESTGSSLPVPMWSKVEVRDWLANHEQPILRDLADILYENDIDGDLLLQLNGENMKTDLNISSLGKRKKLEAAIQQIHENT
eukprot:CFRG7051T1